MDTQKITLSYLIVTRNKLPYLKVIINTLLKNKKDDEDIWIADGLSSDGTKEYLEELKVNGKIEYYISEKDFGVAHALNKLILISKGELFKFITDDDAFYYPGIEKCKKFMLENKNVDIVNANGAVLNTQGKFKTLDYDKQYTAWKEKNIPFNFCELGIIFRRSSLPLIGLRDPAFIRADAELSLRLSSYGKVNIAWYTGCTYVNIMNSQSVSLVHMRAMKTEMDRLNTFYLGKNPENFFMRKLKILFIKSKLLLLHIKKGESQNKNWAELMNLAHEWLAQSNIKIKPEFIIKN